MATTLTAFLDTNVLIRHLTGDPPEMAARATAAPTEPKVGSSNLSGRVLSLVVNPSIHRRLRDLRATR
jgi:predicted nucleic acid-binding protein